MKIKKKKYIGGCDNPENYFNIHFHGKPIYLKNDNSKNSANHIKQQRGFSGCSYPSISTGVDDFLFLLKI